MAEQLDFEELARDAYAAAPFSTGAWERLQPGYRARVIAFVGHVVSLAKGNEQFPAFVAAVSQRLDAGRQAYGDQSFSAEPAQLLSELEQEALDLAGWGFVLWVRLQAAKCAAERIEVRP